MIFIIFLVLIAHSIMFYLLFTENQKILDNTLEIGQYQHILAKLITKKGKKCAKKQ